MKEKDMKTKLLLYCTKSKKQLVKWEKYMYGENRKNDKFNSLNGKIVAECDYEVEEIQANWKVKDCLYHYETNNMEEKELLNKSCLASIQINDYLDKKNGYAIHIKNLKIYDEPKELNEYYKTYNNSKTWQRVNKAPQNMMEVDYINIDKNIFLSYILISIRSRWLCKILNGEKTIEVRKKVLKKMLDNDK